MKGQTNDNQPQPAIQYVEYKRWICQHGGCTEAKDDRWHVIDQEATRRDGLRNLWQNGDFESYASTRYKDQCLTIVSALNFKFPSNPKNRGLR